MANSAGIRLATTFSGLRVALRNLLLRHVTSLPNDGKKFDEGG
jgi:hypothetical protein